MGKAIVYLTARKDPKGSWAIYGSNSKAKLLKGERGTFLKQAGSKAHAIKAVEKMKESLEAKGKTVKMIAS